MKIADFCCPFEIKTIPVLPINIPSAMFLKGSNVCILRINNSVFFPDIYCIRPKAQSAEGKKVPSNHKIEFNLFLKSLTLCFLEVNAMDRTLMLSPITCI